ncbi:TPA: type II toxin-antitoxin system Phd/YefM family antitoxin [Candidatus Bipolaricaulota bacterium]|nr:type II toxin-antitoxin system Phd/YefM family antitoxin [Candidatus Bipolaricaulota bacterium]
MRDLIVSTREMSRGFTKLLRMVVKEGAEVTITSRGEPVAVLCPYERYKKAMRRQALDRLMELADRHLKGLTLEETYQSSRADLERRGEGDG